MKVLICGGREFNDTKYLRKELDKLHEKYRFTLVIQGYARGADKLAHYWAKERGIESTGNKYEVTKEDWLRQGRAAGIIRNGKMIKLEKPDMVIAFPGGPGTANTVSRAKKKNIPVIELKGKNG